VSIGRGALANPDLPARLLVGKNLEPFVHAMLSPMATIANALAWRVAVS
jgi:2,4-dienoyl-CoA reductase-like NADH-dependent reductase (Old Yellow Enzyme family)